MGVAVDVAEGLDYLHSRRMLHGDVKSHNVLIGTRRRGGTPHSAASAWGALGSVGPVGPAGGQRARTPTAGSVDHLAAQLER